MGQYGMRYSATPVNIGEELASVPDDVTKMRMENQQREQMRQAALAEYAGQGTAGQMNPVSLLQPIATPQNGNPLTAPAGNATMDQNQAARAGAQAQPSIAPPSARATAQLGQAQSQPGQPAVAAGPVGAPIAGPPQMDAGGIEQMRQNLRSSPDRLLMQQHLAMLGLSPGAISNLFSATPLNPGTQKELFTAAQNGFTGLPQFASGTQTADYAREQQLEREQAASSIQGQKSYTAEDIAKIRAAAVAEAARVKGANGSVKLDPSTARSVRAALPLAQLLDNDIKLYNSYQLKPDGAMYDQVTNAKLARIPGLGDYLNANPEEPFQKMTTADKSRFLTAMEMASAISGNSGRGVNPEMVHEFFKALPGPDTPPKQAAYMFNQVQQQAFGRSLGGVAYEQNLSNPGSTTGQRYLDAQKLLQQHMTPVYGIQYNPKTNLPVLPEYGMNGEEFGTPAGQGAAPAGGPGKAPALPADSLRAPGDAPANVRGAWATRLAPIERQKIMAARSNNHSWDDILAAPELKGKIR